MTGLVANPNRIPSERQLFCISLRFCAPRVRILIPPQPASTEQTQVKRSKVGGNQRKSLLTIRRASETRAPCRGWDTKNQERAVANAKPGMSRYVNVERCAIKIIISDQTQRLATGFRDGLLADHLAQCDELKPCSNCTRHGVLCSLVDPNAAPPVPAPASSSGSSNAPKRTAKPKTVRLALYLSDLAMVDSDKYTGTSRRKYIINGTFEACRPGYRAIRCRIAQVWIRSFPLHHKVRQTTGD